MFKLQKMTLFLLSMNLTQQRYLGFLKTQFLWEGELFGMNQFLIDDATEMIDRKVSDTIRLGNYVEHLVSYQLSQNENIEVLNENVQIIQDKQTIGEIDCLLKCNNKPIHLEIAYKFYLFDSSVGASFLEHWIGPNRRDSLVLKLNKTKNKQFPLLYHDACKDLLNDLGLDSSEILQNCFFKAQLFMPYKKEVPFEGINSDCISGFYVNQQQFKECVACKFYIPKKLDWLIEPHPNVDWLSFTETKSRVYEFFEKQSSPLLWMKSTNGEIKKVFVVWW